MKVSQVHKQTKRFVDVEFDQEDRDIVIESDQEDVEPIRLELEYEPSPYSYCNEVKVVKTENGYRVGYLVDDDSPEDPSENWDGFGKFGECNSRVRNDIQEVYREAIGADRYGDLEFDSYQALEELSYVVWPVRESRDIDDLLIDPKAKATRENIRRPYRGKWDKIIEQHRADGDFGDPDAVFLNVYEHGGKMYEVPGDAAYHVDAQWDWSFGGAVWVPDKVLRVDEAKGLSKKKRREMMVTWARQAVSVFNEYMNGNVFGVVIQNHDINGDLLNEDSCFGYYGSDDAERELRERMNYKREDQAHS